MFVGAIYIRIKPLLTSRLVLVMRMAFLSVLSVALSRWQWAFRTRWKLYPLTGKCEYQVNNVLHSQHL